MEFRSLKEGDEVIITIEKENRDWGYNPFPDGTKATVLGFVNPEFPAWVMLRLKNGREHTEFYTRLKLASQKRKRLSTNSDKKTRGKR